MRRPGAWIGACLLAGVAAAAGANGGDDEAAAFQASCAGCHDAAKARELAGKYGSPEELDAYLTTHFTKDAESRRRIIAFLRARADAP
jgi:cytochrome c553